MCGRAFECKAAFRSTRRIELLPTLTPSSGRSRPLRRWVTMFGRWLRTLSSLKRCSRLSFLTNERTKPRKPVLLGMPTRKSGRDAFFYTKRTVLHLKFKNYEVDRCMLDVSITDRFGNVSSRHCGVFCGDVKVFLTKCRNCDRPRPTIFDTKPRVKPKLV